ncbi:glycine-rich RNA-binding protein 4, mitochondrial-like isoform X2 [Punica granatum]|uniref:RRM domain-containing protein n=2 Tax=Punica granatum TaxID=22663 RepID=A0A218WNZ3_PUNGR|nr:glycine-rich RNA-binding protein 4, mitochondrial-like isoform X2 [Punica granatum]OWM74198.1 hypothetical protein CDL15_Pgr008511 [Punica granatum]PKI78521.1 hypothetical protein CRG98_001079 [Punica granatum]
MMLSWSWTSSSSIELPQSAITAAAVKPSISIPLSLTRNSRNAHSPSPKFRFAINHRSSVRALSSCPASSSSVEQRESPSPKLFIKGLARSTREGQLKKAFSEFGEVTRVQIIRDKESEQSLGYGFIWFSSEESANFSVKEMNGKFFYGRFILVAVAKPNLHKRLENTTPYRF